MSRMPVDVSSDSDFDSFGGEQGEQAFSLKAAKGKKGSVSKAADGPKKTTTGSKRRVMKDSGNKDSDHKRPATSSKSDELEAEGSAKENDTSDLHHNLVLEAARKLKASSARQSTSEGREAARLRSEVERLRGALAKANAKYDELESLRSTEIEAEMDELRTRSDERIQDSRKTLNLYLTENEELRERVQHLTAQNDELNSQLAGGRGDILKPRVTSITNADGEEFELQQKEREIVELSTELQREASARRKWEKEYRDLANRFKEDLQAARDDVHKEVKQRLDGDAAEILALREKAERAELERLEEMKHAQAEAERWKMEKQNLSKNPGQDPDDAKKCLDLHEAMTGLSVLRVRAEGGVEIFDCLIGDAKTKRCLHFRILRRSDKRSTYQPQALADRDSAVLEILQPEFQKEMTFATAKLGLFFRNLWTQINGLE